MTINTSSFTPIFASQEEIALYFLVSVASPSVVLASSEVEEEENKSVDSPSLFLTCMKPERKNCDNALIIVKWVLYLKGSLLNFTKCFPNTFWRMIIFVSQHLMHAAFEFLPLFSHVHPWVLDPCIPPSSFQCHEWHFQLD